MTPTTLRLRLVGPMAVLAMAVSGCGLAGLTGGAAAGGASAADQAQSTRQVAETSAHQAKAASGEGHGRVPGTVGCPADVDAVATVVAQVGSRSSLTNAETLAFDVLLRSARACDPLLTGVDALNGFQSR